MKKLVGRKDIEDAMQRLESVIVEEARMAVAEARKAIHDVGYKVGDEAQGIHDAVRAVGDRVGNVEAMIKGVKGIGDMVIIGTQKNVQLTTSVLIVYAIFCQKTGRQIANDPHAPVTEIRKILHGSDNRIWLVDNNTQGMRETLECVSDRTWGVHKAHTPVNEIEVSGVHGTQAILITRSQYR